LKGLWRDYRSHRAKNVAWIVPDLVRRGARTLLGFREAADKDASHTAVLDTLKQLGFYTDFVGTRHWSVPTDLVNRDLTLSIYRIGTLLIKGREASNEENTLLVKHLGPDSEHGLTQQGLAAFFKEATERGLVDHGEDTIKRFVFGGMITGA